MGACCKRQRVNTAREPAIPGLCPETRGPSYMRTRGDDGRETEKSVRETIQKIITPVYDI